MNGQINSGALSVLQKKSLIFFPKEFMIAAESVTAVIKKSFSRPLACRPLTSRVLSSQHRHHYHAFCMITQRPLAGTPHCHIQCHGSKIFICLGGPMTLFNWNVLSLNILLRLLKTFRIFTHFLCRPCKLEADVCLVESPYQSAGITPIQERTCGFLQKDYFMRYIICNRLMLLARMTQLINQRPVSQQYCK